MKLTQSPIFGLLLPFVEQKSQSTCAFRLTSAAFLLGALPNCTHVGSRVCNTWNQLSILFHVFAEGKTCLSIMKCQCLKIVV